MCVWGGGDGAKVEQLCQEASPQGCHVMEKRVLTSPTVIPKHGERNRVAKNVLGQTMSLSTADILLIVFGSIGDPNLESAL